MPIRNGNDATVSKVRNDGGLAAQRNGAANTPPRDLPTNQRERSTAMKKRALFPLVIPRIDNTIVINTDKHVLQYA